MKQVLPMFTNPTRPYRDPASRGVLDLHTALWVFQWLTWQSRPQYRTDLHREHRCSGGPPQAEHTSIPELMGMATGGPVGAGLNKKSNGWAKQKESGRERERVGGTAVPMSSISSSVSTSAAVTPAARPSDGSAAKTAHDALMFQVNPVRSPCSIYVHACCVTADTRPSSTSGCTRTEGVAASSANPTMRRSTGPPPNHACSAAHTSSPTRW